MKAILNTLSGHSALTHRITKQSRAILKQPFRTRCEQERMCVISVDCFNTFLYSKKKVLFRTMLKHLNGLVSALDANY